MYKASRSSWLKHLDFIVLDILCMAGAFLLAYFIRLGFSSPISDPLYRDMAIILVLIDVAVVLFNESYKSILRRGMYKELMAVMKHVSFVVGGSSVVLLLMQRGAQYSRIIFVLMWGFQTAITYVAHLAWKYYLKKRRKNTQKSKRSLLVITSKDRAKVVVQNILKNNFEEFIISGICVIDDDLRGKKVQGIPIVAGEADVLEYICKSWVDEVFMNISSALPLSENMINSCVEMGVTVHLKLAKVTNIIGQKQIVEKIGGYTVLSSSINMVTERQLFAKRFLDITGGIAGILATGLLYIFVAPAIYIKSPGPIFFAQWRVGKNGKKFKIYKFRSMYLDAEERKKDLMEQNKIKDGMMFKMENDPRIIGGEKGKGIGTFIRNTSIDEFPQFLNVLKGDMSLVGTRPPTVDEWDKYELNHRKRLAIKPGITGMWQISGRSDIVDFEEVVALDAEYITNWSIGLDIKILFRTVLVVLGKRGAS